MLELPTVWQEQSWKVRATWSKAGTAKGKGKAQRDYGMARREGDCEKQECSQPAVTYTSHQGGTNRNHDKRHGFATKIIHFQ